MIFVFAAWHKESAYDLVWTVRALPTHLAGSWRARFITQLLRTHATITAHEDALRLQSNHAHEGELRIVFRGELAVDVVRGLLPKVLHLHVKSSPKTECTLCSLVLVSRLTRRFTYFEWLPFLSTKLSGNFSSESRR